MYEDSTKSLLNSRKNFHKQKNYRKNRLKNLKIQENELKSEASELVTTMARQIYSEKALQTKIGFISNKIEHLIFHSSEVKTENYASIVVINDMKKYSKILNE